MQPAKFFLLLCVSISQLSAREQGVGQKNWLVSACSPKFDVSPRLLEVIIDHFGNVTYVPSLKLKRLKGEVNKLVGTAALIKLQASAALKLKALMFVLRLGLERNVEGRYKSL